MTQDLPVRESSEFDIIDLSRYTNRLNPLEFSIPRIERYLAIIDKTVYLEVLCYSTNYRFY